MKALTVYQPWATLIIAGAKPFEFRGWSPRERGGAYASLIGQRIGIHASARPMRAQEIRSIVDNLQFGGANAAMTCLRPEAALDILLPLYHFKKPDGLPLSCLLGTAELGEPRNAVDIAVEDFGFPGYARDELKAMPNGLDSDRDMANFGWPMLDVDRWHEPVPMRGAQGFWHIPGPEAVGL